MVPVHTAGELQGCALKRVDERALVFQKQKKILAWHLWEKQSGKKKKKEKSLAWQDWIL